MRDTAGLHEQPGYRGAPHFRAAVALTAGFALFTLIVFTTSGYFRSPESFRESLAIGLPMMIVDGFIGFQLYFVLRWTAPLKPILRWALVAVAVIAIALIQALWDTQLRIWADTIVGDLRSAYVRSVTLNTYNTGMLAALLAVHAAYGSLKEQQHLLETARRREREAQMLALRFQLNPHFLFNTLNAISSLVVVGRARDAEAMIERLSSFLRNSLAADPDHMVGVEEEFEMLQDYLEIEGVRFGERLMTSVDLPGALSDVQMPPFLLQPLVENAVKYAVAPSRTQVRITISAREHDGRLELCVGDSGSDSPMPAGGTGVGLANVRERLRLNFGSQSDMRVDNAGGGFRVVLSMPIMRRPATAPMTIAA